MGNCRRALQMIMEELEDVDKAIEFAKEQDDAELWEDLISYSIDKPRTSGLCADCCDFEGTLFFTLYWWRHVGWTLCHSECSFLVLCRNASSHDLPLALFPAFITGLLNNIGTHVDPILLIHRIKEGMEIPNLRDSLVKILQDYNLQVQSPAAQHGNTLKELVMKSVCVWMLKARGFWMLRYCMCH